MKETTPTRERATNRSRQQTVKVPIDVVIGEMARKTMMMTRKIKLGVRAVVSSDGRQEDEHWLKNRLRQKRKKKVHC